MNKYRNKKVDHDGVKFDSEGEYKYWLLLQEEEKKGKIKHLQRQVKIEILPKQKYADGKIKHRAINYIADYVYEDEEGNIHYQDYKGYPTNEWKLKNKLFSYTINKDIEIITAKDDKKGNNRRTGKEKRS